MHFKNSFLFLGAILASGTVADNAHEVEDASNLGTVTKAYIDPDTHTVFVADVSENKSSAVQERSYNTGNTQNTDTIVKILKKYNGYGYCKAACAGYSPEPVTQTEYKTVTKSTYTTKTIVPNPVKTTSTATAAAPPANTVAITITESTTIDVTETAEPSTITSTISTTSTLTETSTTIITSVVQLPTAPSVKKRGQSPPSYLRGYASHLICPACNQAWPKPKPKTVTLCKTTTKIATITRTSTKAAQTQTAIVTITPAAGTETSTAINVQTLTNTVTSTPTETDTITLTATTTTTDVATSTVSACAQQTNGVAGISVSGSGSHLVDSSANTVVDCCTACYNAATGCSEWAFLGSGFCFYAVNSDATGAGGTCPNGLGTGTLFTGGPIDLAGGPGPCHS